jgi:hypothetical protein
MTKKHMKKKKSLAIKEMQMKTTLRFHLTPIRIPTIKNTTKGMQTSATTLERKIWRLLKNLNIDLPYYPVIPLWEYTQSNVTQVTPEALAHTCLLQHYSQQPSYGNSQDAPLLTNP